MHFGPRLLRTFHTSLKAAEMSPLTVLAGVSGTGKSELPRLYARFGGLAFLPLAVQPNWDSPQSLFGYFNSVENRFNATELLQAMVQFQPSRQGSKREHSQEDRLLLVLLDEMNLAYVEQYFSDLLSKLEQRRGDTKNASLLSTWSGESISTS
jgi:5-methylcytosine-specific restriction endonuclease McrBC GTP-binding regulatory subunit McrB